MADPIPLVHNGIIRAWMCGVCQRVHAYDTGSDHLRDQAEVVPATEWQEERTVGGWHTYKVERFDRGNAERCCRCRDCGRDLKLPRAWDAWCCKRCGYLNQWIHTIQSIAKAIATAGLVKRPAPVPIVPLPPDEAWHQGGNGGRGHATWPIAAGISELSEDAYCATWMDGAAFDIWGFGTGDDRDSYGNIDGAEAKERAEEIVAVAKEQGVWWYYRSPLDSADENDPIRRDPNDYFGPWPVTLATWAKMLAVRDVMRRAEVRRG